jgi:hypothetical protein
MCLSDLADGKSDQRQGTSRDLLVGLELNVGIELLGKLRVGAGE